HTARSTGIRNSTADEPTAPAPGAGKENRPVTTGSASISASTARRLTWNFLQGGHGVRPRGGDCIICGAPLCATAPITTSRGMAPTVEFNWTFSIPDTSAEAGSGSWRGNRRALTKVEESTMLKETISELLAVARWLHKLSDLMGNATEDSIPIFPDTVGR